MLAATIVVVVTNIGPTGRDVAAPSPAPSRVTVPPTAASPSTPTLTTREAPQLERTDGTETYCWSDTETPSCEDFVLSPRSGQIVGVAAADGLGAATVAGDTTPGVAVFDGRTGETLWGHAFQRSPRAAPEIENNRLFVVEPGAGGSSTDELHAFQANTGRHLWTTRLPFLADTRPPLPAGSWVALSGDTEAVVVRAADGGITLRHEGTSSISGQALRDSAWYVATVCGTVQARVRAGPEERLWETPGTDVAVAPDNRRTFIVGCGGQVEAVEPLDGARLWSHQIERRAGRWSIATVDDRYVYVLEYTEGTLWALDGTTGEQQLSLTLEDGTRPSPSALSARGGLLVVATQSGVLAVRPANAPQVTTLASNQPVDATDVDVDGNLVVAAINGSVVVAGTPQRR